jgi:hypothetical protein
MEQGRYELRLMSSRDDGIDIIIKGLSVELVESFVATMQHWGAVPFLFGWQDGKLLRILPPRGPKGVAVYIEGLIWDDTLILPPAARLKWGEIWAEFPETTWTELPERSV